MELVKKVKNERKAIAFHLASRASKQETDYTFYNKNHIDEKVY